MKKLTSLLLTAMMLVLLASGCGSSGAPADGGPQSTPQDKDSVTIGISVSLDSLEPMSAYSREEQYVIYNVFDTLIEFYDGKYQPRLAESFEMSDDMKEFTFKLRQDVTFHNGEKMTAKDVKYTFDNLANFAFWANDARYIDHTEIIDDYTVKIYAKDTTATNLVVISQKEIINEKAVTELGEKHRFAPVAPAPTSWSTTMDFPPSSWSGTPSTTSGKSAASPPSRRSPTRSSRICRPWPWPWRPARWTL